MFSTPEPWELQYFKGIDPTVEIPVSDEAAYLKYPKFNWVYNKMSLMRTVGIEAYPLGVVPTSFPVFVKPIINLWGMGIGAVPLYDYDEYQDYKPGYMWMPMLDGIHWSFDLAVRDGVILWMSSTTGEKDSYGSFTSWKVHSTNSQEHRDFLDRWIVDFLPDYTGMVNFEFIGMTMIECHLRMTSQWIDLYPPGFLPCVTNFYETREWVGVGEQVEGYSFIVRTERPAVYPTFEYQNPNISSYQLTYRQGINVDQEANDAVSYRLAVVNGTNYSACKEAADQLRNIITGGLVG